MQFLFSFSLVLVLLITACPVSAASPALKVGDLSIGRNLQAYATVELSQPAPAGGMQIVINSSDPARLLVAPTPEVAGKGSLTLTVKAGFRESPEFWLQSLADSGDVSFSATAEGYEAAKGKASLTPSGVVVIGPYGEAAPPEFATTPRGWPTKMGVRVARLDSELQPVESQYIRGGYSLDVKVETSDPAVGAVTPSSIAFATTGESQSIQFKPSAGGKTNIKLKLPEGFKVPAKLNNVAVTVKTPGMAVGDDVTVGENLQFPVALSLGEPAPEGGVKVTLTSADPKKLLLSPSPTEIGKGSIEIDMPAGSVSTTYYLQALSNAGEVEHKAVAPGYAPRTGKITLAPSGVIISLEHHGPPDEAELFRPESAGSKQNKFVALLAEPHPTSLIVYTAYLDPVSKRSADITVQQLRAGLSIPVEVVNANPKVGIVEAKPVIKGGSDRGLFPFKPTNAGETVISVVTPKGFTTPTNAIELLAIVR